MTAAANNPPRKHHFITQSWIKRFADKNGDVCSYDRDSGELRVRSTSSIMKIDNLNTVDPDGVDDTSLETIELQKIDNDGATVMSAVIGGDDSASARRRLAEFFAVQLLRDPERLFSYAIAAQKFVASIFVETFSTSDYTDFRNTIGDLVTETEYDHLRSLGLKAAAIEFARIQIALQKPGGLPELPFTDLVRSNDGRDRLRDVLLSLDWHVIKAAPHSFILGDTGVLFDPGNLQAGLRAPLSSSDALILTHGKSGGTGKIAFRAARDYEPSSMNFESAARSRRWLAGSRENLERVKSQVTGEPLPTR